MTYSLSKPPVLNMGKSLKEESSNLLALHFHLYNNQVHYCSLPVFVHVQYVWCECMCVCVCVVHAIQCNWWIPRCMCIEFCWEIFENAYWIFLSHFYGNICSYKFTDLFIYLNYCNIFHIFVKIKLMKRNISVYIFEHVQTFKVNILLHAYSSVVLLLSSICHLYTGEEAL